MMLGLAARRWRPRGAPCRPRVAPRGCASGGGVSLARSLSQTSAGRASGADVDKGSARVGLWRHLMPWRRGAASAEAVPARQPEAEVTVGAPEATGTASSVEAAGTGGSVEAAGTGGGGEAAQSGSDGDNGGSPRLDMFNPHHRSLAETTLSSRQLVETLLEWLDGRGVVAGDGGADPRASVFVAIHKIVAHAYVPVSEQMVDDFDLVDPDLTGKHRSATDLDAFAAERRLVAMGTEALIAAQYRLINRQEQDLCQAIQPNLSLPTKVEWERLEGGMLGITDPYAEIGVEPPPFADKMSLFYRGIGVHHTRGFFYGEKVDLLYGRTRDFLIRCLTPKSWRERIFGPELQWPRHLPRAALDDMPLTLRNLLGRVSVVEPTVRSVAMIYRQYERQETASVTASVARTRCGRKLHRWAKRLRGRVNVPANQAATIPEATLLAAADWCDALAVSLVGEEWALLDYKEGEEEWSVLTAKGDPLFGQDVMGEWWEAAIQAGSHPYLDRAARHQTAPQSRTDISQSEGAAATAGAAARAAARAAAGARPGAVITTHNATVGEPSVVEALHESHSAGRSSSATQGSASGVSDGATWQRMHPVLRRGVVAGKEAGTAASDSSAHNNLERVHRVRVYFREYRDVPLCDLELGFPALSMRMKDFDRLKLVMLGLGGVGLGFQLAHAEALSTAGMLAASSLGALLMRVWFRWSAFKVYVEHRAMNRSVDHWQSAHRASLVSIVQQAVDAESKSAMLLYCALLDEQHKAVGQASDNADDGWLSSEHLQAACDALCSEVLEAGVGFKAQRALPQLQRLQLVHVKTGAHGRQLVRVVPPADAVGNLRRQWKAWYPKTARLRSWSSSIQGDAQP